MSHYKTMSLRVTVTFLSVMILVVLLLVSGVKPRTFAAPILPTSTPLPCITFDTVAEGATYVPGRLYRTGGGAELAVTSISGRGWPWLDLLTVFPASDPHRVHEGLLRDARVQFYPVRTTTTKATLYVRQLTGNVTLSVNGKTHTAAAFRKLHGEWLDTVEISVQSLQVPGELLTLRGSIHSFAIGGDELVIDNICLDG